MKEIETNNNVPSKTPEEIKKALECCGKGDGCKRHCQYDLVEGGIEACTSALSRDALAYIERLEARIPKWISVEERLPPDFVSVIAHMTDAGEFPSVREAYAVCGGLRFIFPALREHHPVDYWMEMPSPELPKGE